MLRARKRIIVIWAVFASLLFVIAALEWRKNGGDPKHELRETSALEMFDFAEGDVGALDALYQGRAATLMRDPDGRWFQHGSGHRHGGNDAQPAGEVHRATAEDTAKIARQMTITAAMRADRRIAPDRGLDAYGLANPAMVFMFHGRRGNEIDYSQPLSVLYVGDLEPAEFAFYARREGDKDISLIPRFQISLLLTLTHGAEVAPSLEPKSPAKAAPAPADSTLRR